MQVRKLMHVCIAVPNLEKALDFYCGVLGFKSVFETDNDKADGRLLGFDQDEIGLRAQHVIAPDTDPASATEINIVEFTNPKTIADAAPYEAMNHIGITRLALMVDDTKEAIEAVRNVAGVEIVSEPNDILIVEPDVTLTATWASFKDPFGIFITLSQPPKVEHK